MAPFRAPEREGFEPSRPQSGLPVFETGPFNRSGTSPNRKERTEARRIAQPEACEEAAVHPYEVVPPNPAPMADVKELKDRAKKAEVEAKRIAEQAARAELEEKQRELHDAQQS